MSGSTRSAEKMRLVAMSWGSGKERGRSNWVLGHPLLHALSCTPSLAHPEAHLLSHILLEFLLGGFHFPQVMKLSSHLSTGKSGCLPLSSSTRHIPDPPSPLPGHADPYLRPPSLTLSFPRRGAHYLIWRAETGPTLPHPAGEVLQRHHSQVREDRRLQRPGSLGTFHTLISCASCCPVSRRLSPLAMARPSLQYPWQRLLAC